LTDKKPTQDDLISPLILAQTGANSEATHSHSMGKFSGASESERMQFAQLVNDSNIGWTADGYGENDFAQVLAQTGSHAHSHAHAHAG